MFEISQDFWRFLESSIHIIRFLMNYLKAFMGYVFLENFEIICHNVSKKFRNGLNHW